MQSTPSDLLDQTFTAPYTQSHPLELPQSLPQPHTLETQQPFLQPVPQSFPQSIPQSIPESIPQSVPEPIPQTIPQSSSQSPHSVPPPTPLSDFQNLLPQPTPQVPESIPQYLPEHFPQYNQQQIDSQLDPLSDQHLPYQYFDQSRCEQLIPQPDSQPIFQPPHLLNLFPQSIIFLPPQPPTINSNLSLDSNTSSPCHKTHKPRTSRTSPYNPPQTTSGKRKRGTDLTTIFRQRFKTALKQADMEAEWKQHCFDSRCSKSRKCCTKLCLAFCEVREQLWFLSRDPNFRALGTRTQCDCGTELNW